MDTGDGSRGGRSSGRYSSRGRGRGDQYYSGGGGRYGGQQVDNQSSYYQGGGGRGGSTSRGGYQGQGYNQSYGNFNQGGYRGSSRGRGYWGGRGEKQTLVATPFLKLLFKSLAHLHTCDQDFYLHITLMYVLRISSMYFSGRSSSRGGRGAPDGGRGRGGGGGSTGREPLPPDVESLSELKGHTKKVTCLELDQTSGQLFTGSHDGTVRVWSCTSGECVSTVPVGGEVDSMLIEGGFLFAGVKIPTGQGIVKAWNMATNQEMSLEGHTGRVQCLAAAQGMLFSGGQDQTIRVWKPNPATGAFECAAALRAEQNGHTSSISSLSVSNHIMFSGDAQGGIKVWDLNQGIVIQSLERAHSDNSHPAIMSMLIWEGHLVTGSLDGYIKVWEPSDLATTGVMINVSPIFVFPETPPQQTPYSSSNSSRGGGRGSSRGGGRSGGGGGPPLLPGILSLCGVADPAGKAVVMVSYNGESSIRLWELPSFAERGSLSDVNNVRAMAGFPAGRLMISGDERGVVKVWRWKDAAAALGPGGFPIHA